MTGDGRLFTPDPPNDDEAARIFETRFGPLLDPAHDDKYGIVSRAEARLMVEAGISVPARWLFVCHKMLAAGQGRHDFPARAAAELFGQAASHVSRYNHELTAAGLIRVVARRGRPSMVVLIDVKHRGGSTSQVDPPDLSGRPPRPLRSTEELDRKEHLASRGSPGCRDCGKPVTRKPAEQGGGWNDWCKMCWPAHKRQAARPPGLVTWDMLAGEPEPG